MSTSFNPEMTKVVVIHEVGQRQLNGKNGAFTMYDIRADDGQTYNTTKRDFAEAAFSLVNQQAELVWTDRVNGSFVNHNLVSLPMPPRPNAAQQAQYVQQAQETLGDRAQILTSQLPPAPDPIPVVQSGKDDKAIHRQTAAKVAAALFESGDSAHTFWANVQDLARYFDDGTLPASVSDDIPF